MDDTLARATTAVPLLALLCFLLFGGLFVLLPTPAGADASDRSLRFRQLCGWCAALALLGWLLLLRRW